MKKLGLLFALTSVFACKTNHDLVGTYTTVKNNKIVLALGHINNTYYAVRCKIILNKDSTFIYQSCAMVSRGRWSATPDTLALHIDEKKFKIEKFNIDPAYTPVLRITDKPMKLTITGKQIIEKTTSLSGKH